MTDLAAQIPAYLSGGAEAVARALRIVASDERYRARLEHAYRNRLPPVIRDSTVDRAAEHAARAEIYETWAASLEFGMPVDYFRYGCARADLKGNNGGNPHGVL